MFRTLAPRARCLSSGSQETVKSVVASVESSVPGQSPSRWPIRFSVNVTLICSGCTQVMPKFAVQSGTSGRSRPLSSFSESVNVARAKAPN